MAKKIETAKIAPMNVTASKSGMVTIPGVRYDYLTTLIIGDAPLISHAFAQKTRGQILARHMGEASAGREKKDPHANFEAARYRLADGSDGVMAGGLKAAIVDGFGRDAGVFVSKAKGAIRVEADDPALNLVRIYHKSNPDASDIMFFDSVTPEEYARSPRLREDIVRNESGVVDIRHRPEYWPWAIKLVVKFLPAIASQMQVLQAIAKAGFTVGLNEWRPSSPKSKSGTYGTWRLATAQECEQFENGSLFVTAMKQAAE